MNKLRELDRGSWFSYPLEKQLPDPSRSPNREFGVPRELREKIFSPELKELTRGVLKRPREVPERRKKSPSAPSAILAGQKEASAPDWFTPAHSPFPDEILRLIFAGYRRKISMEETCGALLEYMADLCSADSGICLLPDDTHFVYRPFSSINIDKKDFREIYFSLDDPYLVTRRAARVIHFRDFDDDAFFKKRFTRDFFRHTDRALILNLTLYEFPGYFAFFYRKPGEEPLRIAPELLIAARDIIPLLYRRAEVALEYGDDFSRKAFDLLKQARNRAGYRLNVARFTFPGLFEHSAGRYLLRNIARILRGRMLPEERLFLLPPNAIALALTGSLPEPLLELGRELAERSGFAAETTLQSFPEAGSNLYNYLS